MSKAGQRLLQGAREALEFAKGNANPDDYRVHRPMVEEPEFLDGQEFSDAATTIADGDASRLSRPIPHRPGQAEELPQTTNDKAVST